MTETILLAVTGMSPAILTETVWALAHPADGSEPVIPARVLVLTTRHGREQLAQLFTPDPALGDVAPWDALRAALVRRGHDLTGQLRFGQTADDIRVITALDPATGQSRELADLRTPADNEAAADFLLEQVRGLVSNPDLSLIASLAGGRKTMGALLYACLTLAGRETDRLTHVLVSEPFETLRGFWFPGQPGGNLAVRGGEAISPSEARVELADVPFVPLRNLFYRDLGQPAGTFRRLLELCRENVRQTAAENLKLEISRSRPETLVNGRLLELSAREHLVLLFFAHRAKQGETVLSAYDEALGELNDFRIQLRASAPADDWSDWRHAAGLNEEFNERGLTRVLSDLRAKTRRAGGEAAFLADLLPAKGRCALTVPGARIFVRD